MKTDQGHFTHQEILSQPEAWAAALEVLREHEHDILGIRPAGHFDQAIFTGCLPSEGLVTLPWNGPEADRMRSNSRLVTTLAMRP